MATATPQAIIILFGSFVITAIGLTRLGSGDGISAGWTELVTTAKGNADNFALWRPLSDKDFPWLGVLIASPIIGIWYWCTDQYIVQRTLTAKARQGAVGADEGLLGDVLHQVDIAHHAADQTFDAPLVLDDQHLEGLGVAALDARHQG